MIVVLAYPACVLEQGHEGDHQDANGRKFKGPNVHTSMGYLWHKPRKPVERPS